MTPLSLIPKAASLVVVPLTGGSGRGLFAGLMLLRVKALVPLAPTTCRLVLIAFALAVPDRFSAVSAPGVPGVPEKLVKTPWLWI